MHRTGSVPELAVLHILAPAPFGGLESVVRMLALAQMAQGYRVCVALTLENGRGEQRVWSQVERDGVTILRICLSRRAYFREYRELIRVCHQVSPDVIHTHGYRADVVGGFVARRLRIPAVTTVHGFTGGDRKNRLYERVQRWSLRRFQAVVAVCRPLADRLEDEGIAPERLHVVRNAWRPVGHRVLARDVARDELGISRTAFVVGWVGRLSEEKGPEVLIDALAYLRDLSPVVTIIGDGSVRHALVTRANAIRVGHMIRWQGALSGAARFFTAFDVFVLSSHTEGVPIVLFEAMAAGVPIVASNVGGVRDIASPATAVLVQPNDPAALARGVREVYERPDSVRKRVQAGRSRLENEFTPELWTHHYGKVYHSAIGAERITSNIQLPRQRRDSQTEPSIYRPK